MNQIISFEKDIVFKNNVAVINSISLEHNEKIINYEIEGTFCVFGDYKIHNDTTELENFKFELPYSTLLPDDVLLDSVSVDIDNFVYELVDSDVLRVKIDFKLSYELEECDELEKFINENNLFEDDDRDVNLNLVNDSFNDNVIMNDVDLDAINNEKNSVIENIDNDNFVIDTVENEYIIYHIHIVQEGDTIESIMKKYDVTLDYIKEYNDITDIKIGTKLIIPENINE